jgi:hypothetical protein
MAFRLGHPNLPDSANCCGKPIGCTATDGCLMLSHPWKRAMLFDDRTVRCQAWTGGASPEQCLLLNGHDGECR